MTRVLVSHSFMQSMTYVASSKPEAPAKDPIAKRCRGAQILVLGSLPPPMYLPRQTLVYPLASYQQVHAGEGGRVQLDSPPLHNPLPHNIAALMSKIFRALES
jgi:hypothetical protein